MIENTCQKADKYYISKTNFSGCSVARSSRLLWEQEVGGSNPATPTKKSSFIELFLFTIETGCGAAW